MHPENAREFLNRRQWLWSGGAGFGALALGAMEARGGVNPSAARAGNQSARAKRVIFLFMEGGPSHIDTFDPKPNAPAEIRGPFSTIPTRVPGIRFTELFEGLPVASFTYDVYGVIRE